jgi:glycosyltransferase involved in cell wall biosynthesis
MKKIAIIGTAGVPARYGGFETLVHHLVKQWKGKYKTTVYCSKTYYNSNERPEVWNGAKLVYLPLNANGVTSIFYDIISMIHALFYADVLLILGVSGGIFIPFVKLLTKKKIIVNIDGLEWRRAKWGKITQRFLRFSEYLAVKFSDADITDNEALKRYTAVNYGTLSFFVAYGADHVEPCKPKVDELIKYPFLKDNYFFKVCRIEPENNVHVILDAFSELEDKKLVIVGNWSNSEYGNALFNQYGGGNENIILLDPIYEQRELDLLRSNCGLYIHGHSAGGTNPSLVEAMFLGLPILAYDVAYNRCTMQQKGLYFRDCENLIGVLNELTIPKLSDIRKDMRNVASEFYTWEVIANKYDYLIKSLSYDYQKTSVEPMIASISESSLRRLQLSHLRNTIKFHQTAYHYE